MMSSKETFGVRRRVWLVGGLLLLLLITSIYGVARSFGETLPFSDLGTHPPNPEGFVPTVNVAPEIDVERLAESLAQTLNRHLEQRVHPILEEMKEIRRIQARLIKELKKELDGKAEMQSSKLTGLDQRLHSIESGLGQVLETIENQALEPSIKPAFVFRGIEIWHGQVYALLEHEGRIVPVREGESRLGWRVHVIDRDGRKLHVGDGMNEYVLEVQ